jgi:hypothetical protein
MSLASASVRSYMEMISNFLYAHVLQNGFKMILASSGDDMIAKHLSLSICYYKYDHLIDRKMSDIHEIIFQASCAGLVGLVISAIHYGFRDFSCSNIMDKKLRLIYRMTSLTMLYYIACIKK